MLHSSIGLDWLGIWLLIVIGYYCVGILLAVWRQPNDDSFLIAMIHWGMMPLLFWLVPFSSYLRQAVVSFWRGMDWIPPPSE